MITAKMASEISDGVSDYVVEEIIIGLTDEIINAVKNEEHEAVYACYEDLSQDSVRSWVVQNVTEYAEALGYTVTVLDTELHVTFKLSF